MNRVLTIHREDSDLCSRLIVCERNRRRLRCGAAAVIHSYSQAVSYRCLVPANLLSENDKSRSGFGNDNTHYPYPCRRRHDRAVTGLWLASLHDGKRGTRQVSQGASYLARHQPLLDIRDSACAFATLACGSARAYATTRNRGSAYVSLTTRNRGSAFLPTRNR